jgi:hypothetical protein
MIADMHLASAALIAIQARDMRLTRNVVAGLQACHLIANLDHLSRKFVPKRHRRFDAGGSPVIPMKNMEVRAAQRRRFDPYQDTMATDLWHWKRLKRNSRGGLHFADCSHCGHKKAPFSSS